MTVFDAWCYGDPEKVAIRREEDRARALAACGQCTHRVSMVLNGKQEDRCEYGRWFGKRCESYKVRKPHAST